MAIGNGVVLRFLADTSNAVTQIGKMEKALDRTLTTGEQMDVWSKKLGISIAAVGAAAVAMAAKSVAAYAEDERAATSLATTLQNLGLAHDTDRIENYIDSLQRATGVADSELRPSFDRLIRSTGSVSEAQRALQIALDASVGTGRSVQEVANALGRAYDGNTTALSRLGIGLDSATLKSGDLNAITAQMAIMFSGQAANAANTLQGSMSRVKIATDELIEAFGEGLVGRTQDTVDATNNLTDAMKDAEPLITAVGTALGMVGESTLEVLTAIYDLGAGILTLDWDQFVRGLDALTGTSETFGIEQEEAAAAVSGTVTSAIALGNTLPGVTRIVDDAADAASNAARSYLAMWEAAINAQRAARDLGNTSGTVTSAIAEGVRTGGAAGYWEKLQVQYGETERVARRAAGGASALTQSTTDLRDVLRSGFADYYTSELKKLEGALESAQKQVDSWKSSFRDSLASAFDISGTFENAIGEDGKVVASKWQAGVDQAFAQFEWYTNVLKAVKAQGGSDALIAYLREQGVAAGGAQGQAMLDNGLIPYFSEKLTDVEKIAAETADAMVPAFYSSGVEQAQKSYEGFRDNFKVGGPAYKAVMNVMDNLAADAARNARLNVEITRNVNEVITRVVQEISAPKPVVGPKRALGGAVMAGTPYIVGEVGPELFVPSGSGSIVPNDALGGRALNVTVNAGVGDPRAIGQAVVEAITRFEQSNGKVYARAS